MIKASAFWLFTLIALALPCLIQATYDPQATWIITCPNSGTTWKRGQTRSIKWWPNNPKVNPIPATFNIYFEVNNNGHPQQYLIETVKTNIKNTTFQTTFTVPETSQYYNGTLGTSQFVLVFENPTQGPRYFSQNFKVI